MARYQLTDRKIATAKPIDKEYFLADGDGLYLRVRPGTHNQPTGLRTWIFRYTNLSGKPDKKSLGTYPERTLAAARDEAEKCRRLLLDEIDPRSTEQKIPKTVLQAVDQWIKESLVNRRLPHGVHVCRLRLNKHILAHIGNDSLRTLTRPKLIGLLDRIRLNGTPAQAGCVLIDLVQMLNYAEDRDWVVKNPIRTLKKRDIEVEDVVRERVLHPPEILILRDRLVQPIYMTNACKAGIWIGLSTLCRAGEIAGCTEDEIDWETRTWRLAPERTKSKREHLIHLSDFAFYWFCKLRDSPVRQTEYLVPGLKGAPHAKYGSFSHQITARQKDDGDIRDADSLLLPKGKWTMHDLRRTGATLMGELGVPEDIIERCLNHRKSNRDEKNTLIYTYQKQQRLFERKMAFDTLGKYLMNLLGHPDTWRPTSENCTVRAELPDMVGQYQKEWMLASQQLAQLLPLLQKETMETLSPQSQARPAVVSLQ
ncbi:hypothetical protein CAL29_18835 [Bordetella genomosp. 10]|uniref:Tyr recombinase domain-containing protein n=1 Tax=Bordetella genomosp. 10 TaxID=1416804 RepID=A0A261S014_9BORD|nr:integrase arm-type DNA-binding domain-containing protein [Bordetella genomosp. 10]OZI30120.1 hypothetical protein CAL29_18835 [Bordetella genomosp. 10]